MNDKIVELVVLLQGNFVIAPVDGSPESKKNAEKMIVSIIKRSKKDPFLYLKLGEITVLAKYIVGWYFRPPMVNPAVEVIDLLKKQLPPDDGDGWKSS